MALALFMTTNASALEMELGGHLLRHQYASSNELGQFEGAQRSLDSAFGGGVRATLWPTWRFGVEGELQFIPTTMQPAGVSTRISSVRVHGVTRFGSRRLRGLALAGYGIMNASQSSPLVHADDTDGYFYVGAGAQYRVDNLWSVRLDARVHATGNSEPQTTFSFDGQVTFGVAFHIGSEPVNDWDQDGIVDRADICPFAKESFNGVRDEDGCPEDPVIAKSVLSEKERALLKASHRRRQAAAASDGASSGTSTTASAKPGQSGQPERGTKASAPPAKKNPSWLLPPLVFMGDEDGDGLARDDDVCPHSAEDKDGFQDLDGCPDTDNDSDGIVDKSDKCPDDAESLNGFNDTDGCPDGVPKLLKRIVGKLDGVYFEKSSAALKKRSNRALGRAVKVLKKFPRVRVSIEGHTDNVGKPAFNTTLSRQRAESVRTWLITHGIDKSRLEAVGYGPDRPTASNDKRRGRAANRRVEMVLVPPKQPSTAGAVKKTAVKPKPGDSQDGGAKSAPTKPPVKKPDASNGSARSGTSKRGPAKASEKGR